MTTSSRGLSRGPFGTFSEGTVSASTTESACVRTDGVDDVHALDDLAEDDVAAVEPLGLDGGDEELGAVAVRMVCQWSPERPVIGRTHVLGPALAMDSRPGLVCLSLKFSSANFSP